MLDDMKKTTVDPQVDTSEEDFIVFCDNECISINSLIIEANLNAADALLCEEMSLAGFISLYKHGYAEGVHGFSWRGQLHYAVMSEDFSEAECLGPEIKKVFSIFFFCFLHSLFSSFWFFFYFFLFLTSRRNFFSV